MKIEDSRVTGDALGELQGRAREEFEKELAQSDELQRELEGTVIFAKSSGRCHSRETGCLRRRAKLRTECLRML